MGGGGLQDQRGVGVAAHLHCMRWQPMQTTRDPISVPANLIPSTSLTQITSSRKKRKKTKRAKDPNRPKRPPSAFLLYSETRRKHVQAAHPGHATTSVQAKIGEEWRGMDTEEKGVWMKRYDELKVRIAINT